MAVVTGNSIRADEYNGLQSRIAKVLGSPIIPDPFTDTTQAFGYGQTVRSSQVTSITDSVTAEQVEDLRLDMEKAYRHINDTDLPMGSFAQGDIIGADKSGTDITFEFDEESEVTTRTFEDEDTSKGFNDFYTYMTDIESNRFTMAVGQEDPGDIIASSRTNSWSYTSVDAQALYDFGSASAARAFFNAGGKITFEGSTNLAEGSADSQARNEGWDDMLTNVGLVRFGYNFTDVTGSTNGVDTTPSIGYYELTTSYQQVFRKNADAGVYENSYWTIQARSEGSGRYIRFLITLRDDGPEGDPDDGAEGDVGDEKEPVDATLTVTFGAIRPLSPEGEATADDATDDFELPFPSCSVPNGFD